jgi:cytidyltransferase-like protein
MRKVVVTGSFDDLRSRHVRFLEEASKWGDVHVLLWSDEIVRALDGTASQFPQEERFYMLQAIRYVAQVSLVTHPVGRDGIPRIAEIQPDIWAVDETSDSTQKRVYCETHGLDYLVLREDDLQGFPVSPRDNPKYTERLPHKKAKKVIATGSFDWLHSGHIRFFEEASELGDLYVAVGHDKNIRLLKGEGHPLFSQDERLYMVQAIRFVTQALITSGQGWMDAAPEIAWIRPDIYVVNEDGDKPEKQAFCKEHGLEYVVLRRTPKDGLPRRESTVLRGF